MTAFQRASEVFDFPLGAVVHDGVGCDWVYIGAGRNTVGLQLYFAYVPSRAGQPYTYTVALAGSLLKKFPDADRFIAPKGMNNG